MKLRSCPLVLLTLECPSKSGREEMTHSSLYFQKCITIMLHGFLVLGGTPSLEVLWLSQEPAVQAQRLDTLLACFNLSSSREELQAVESPLRALCCLLIYLFVQVHAELTVLYDIESPLSLALPSRSAVRVSMARSRGLFPQNTISPSRCSWR